MKFKALSEIPRNVPADPMNPSKCQAYGFLWQTCHNGGEERKLLTYIPQSVENNDRCIVIAPPENVDVERFLEETELIGFAEKNRCFLSILIPENNQWNLQGKDADFLNAAYKKVQSREAYVVMQDCIYLVGFGKEAPAPQQAAMKISSEWAGLATFGNFEPNVLLNAGLCRDSDEGIQEDEMYISASKTQLPVWMFLEEKDELAENTADYWKKQNKNQKDSLYDRYGTEIFLAPNIQKTSKINSEQISQTCITAGPGRSKVNAQVLDYMWSYIGAARRHRCYGEKVLRYYRDPRKNGASYHRLVVDGFLREWFEYVPESLNKSEDPVPLVIVLHGRGGNGETFFDITDMSVMAEERGFIAVFPTADFYEFKKTGLKNLRLWQGNFEGRQMDSVPFIRTMIQDIQSRLSVDPGRIYACGQSSGGYMTTYLALAASEVFAAVSPWSAYTYPGSKHEVFKCFEGKCFADGHVPICLLFGDKDQIFGTDAKNFLHAESSDINGFVRFIIESYGLEPEPYTYKCPPIQYFVWKNKKGTPMLKIGIVQNMPHANYAEESRIAYDEFFSKFSKAGGKLKYMGRDAE